MVTRSRDSAAASGARFSVPAAPLLAAIALVAVSFRNGSYGDKERYQLGIAACAAVAALGTTDRWSLAVRERATRVALAALGGLLVLTLASAAWAADAEAVLREGNRVGLYLAILVAVMLAVRASALPLWADLLGAATAVVGLAGAASWLLPSLVPSEAFAAYLPAGVPRLSYPVGYWNGLAILLALGTPLLTRAATDASRSKILRGVALAPAPVICVAIYLTGSRGGAALAMAGPILFAVLAAGTWRRLGALSLAAVGSGAATALVARSTAANGRADDWGAVAVVVLASAAVGVAYGMSCGRQPRRDVPAVVVRYGTAVVLGAAVGVGAFLAHPLRAFHAFEAYPANASSQTLESHLASTSGSGRWQLWTAAVDGFRGAWLLGHGAGSFASWWAAHGSLPVAVQDAHSIYLQMLSELGIVGAGLLLLAVGTGFVVGARRVRRPSVDAAPAALLSAFAVYAVAIGIDWMWELTIVSVVGFAVFGLLLRSEAPPGPETVRRRRGGRSRVLVVASAAVVVAQGIALAASLELAASSRAASHGDLVEAASAAARAHTMTPWAASPYLQLALIAEQAGQLGTSRRWAEAAAHADPSSWQAWVVAARVQTKDGDVTSARRSLARARRLTVALDILPRAR